MAAVRNTKPLEGLLLYIKTILSDENTDVRLGTPPEILFYKKFELLKKYMAGLNIINSNLEPAVRRVSSSLQDQIGHSNFTYKYLFDIVAHIIHGLGLCNSLRETPKQSFLKYSQLQILLFNRLVPQSIKYRYYTLNRLIVGKGLYTKRFQITLYNELIEAILNDEEREKLLSVLFVKLQNMLYKFCKALSSSKVSMGLPSHVIGFMTSNYHYSNYLYVIILIGKRQHIKRTIRDNLIKFLCNSVFVLLPKTHEVVANFIIRMLNEYQTIRLDQTLEYINHRATLNEALIFISQDPRSSYSIACKIFDLIKLDESELTKTSRDYSSELLPSAKKGGANNSKKVRRIYKKRNSTKKITRRTRRTRRQSNKKR
jgi:hypothetical protein